MGATRPFPDSLWRTFWTVLKLRPVDSTSIETVCSMLPTRKAWSRTRATGLLKTEDKGPAVSYLTFKVNIHHSTANEDFGFYSNVRLSPRATPPTIDTPGTVP